MTPEEKKRIIENENRLMRVISYGETIACPHCKSGTVSRSNPVTIECDSCGWYVHYRPSGIM